MNSATQDFFMGMWVHFDNYQTSRQFGVDIAGNYVYFELQGSGAVKIRHTGDGGSTSSSTSLNDGNWHHVALSRTNDTLYGFVDGSAVVSDNGGTGGNSVKKIVNLTSGVLITTLHHIILMDRLLMHSSILEKEFQVTQINRTISWK